MTNYELVDKAVEIALAYKTVYGKGMTGHRIDTDNIDDFKKGDYSDWYNTKEKMDKIEPYIGKGYFGFDCVCLIKAIFWGWNGDYSQEIGGVSDYSAFPDHGVNEVFKYDCTDSSSDFSSIEPGEFLVSSLYNGVYGHCGLYIGNGLAVDCTNSGTRNGVAITAVENIGEVKGYTVKSWLQHAKLTKVNYLPDVIQHSILRISRRKYYSRDNVIVHVDSSKMDSSYTDPILGIYPISTNKYKQDYISYKNITKKDNDIQVSLLLNKKDENNVVHFAPKGRYKIIRTKIIITI